MANASRWCRPNENLLSAMKRELEEETSIKSIEIIKRIRWNNQLMNFLKNF